MDRNDKIKQKYYEKKPSNAKARYTGNFDPSPYVDLIFDRLQEEIDEDDIEPSDFLLNMMENPKLEIVFGKSSVLNTAQKDMVIAHLMARVKIAKDFDATPYVNILLDLQAKKDFEQFEKVDKDGDTIFDFSDYFKDENFTREQLEIIEAKFYESQTVSRTTLAQKFKPALFISILGMIIPPFFIPNLMQRFGLISLDAGWFTKISIGVLSLIILFYLAKKLFGIYTSMILKSENLIAVDD